MHLLAFVLVYFSKLSFSQNNILKLIREDKNKY